MRALLITLLFVPALFACETEKDYCRAFCQRAGECQNCGGSIDMDGCIDDCTDLDSDTQKLLANCYKGDCANIFSCSDIIGQVPPNPCYKK